MANPEGAISQRIKYEVRNYAVLHKAKATLDKYVSKVFKVRLLQLTMVNIKLKRIKMTLLYTKKVDQVF